MISIIILNFNGLSDTIECITSLKKVPAPSFDIIIVDNGSKENEAKMIKSKFRNSVIVLRSDVNLGFAGGNNLGIKYALRYLSPKYVLLLNNDTIVEPDFLSKLVIAIERNKNIGVVQPKIYYYFSNNKKTLWSAGGKIVWWKGNVYGRGARMLDKGQFDDDTVLDWATGCAILAKSQVFKNAGLFYSKLFLYWEDTEWSQRVIKAGYKIIFVPDAIVYHKSSISANKYLKHRKTFYYTRNSVIFFKISAPSNIFLISFFIYFTKKILTSLFITLIKRKWDHFSAILSGLAQGITYKQEKR